MKRFVLSFPPSPEGMIRLYESDFHYLVHVRRLRAGMNFDAVLPDGTETRVRILSTVDNILIGECLTPGHVPSEQVPFGKRPSSIPPIALFRGLPKGNKMDLIVRQAAEGGVSLVAPFGSEYSAVRLTNTSAEPDRVPSEHVLKVKRWERIVREARQQSGSAVETVVRPPVGFDTLLEYWESLKKEYRRPLGILFHQEPLETPTGQSEASEKRGSPLAKGTFHDYLGEESDFVAMAVGPEGGFSPREVLRFLAAGFNPLLMGNTILRTETAALYGTAAIRIILLESESWTPRLKGGL